MCTLVVAFYPQSLTPLVIAANRDENPTRPAEDWNFRFFEDNQQIVDIYVPQIYPDVYCPLDVLGGTWIGVNQLGIFCAITNWDYGEDLGGKGLKSRGHLVLNSLKKRSVEMIIESWQTLNPINYKPFHMLAGDINNLFYISCDNKEIIINSLKAGVHISTGLGLNKEVPRDVFIREKLLLNMNSFSQPVKPTTLSYLMKQHNDGLGSENSVCVHDPEHKWETRSSAVMVNDGIEWVVNHKNGPACQDNIWNCRYINIRKAK